MFNNIMNQKTESRENSLIVCWVSFFLVGEHLLLLGDRECFYPTLEGTIKKELLGISSIHVTSICMFLLGII